MDSSKFGFFRLDNIRKGLFSKKLDHIKDPRRARLHYNMLLDQIIDLLKRRGRDAWAVEERWR